MELTGSAITALFVGLVWTLIKVVGYFISKKNGKSGLTSEQDKQIAETHTYLSEMNKYGVLTKDQKDLVYEIHDIVKDLKEVHSVYDENHVPKWYIPSELLPLVRQIHTSMDSLCKEMEENLGDVKSDQRVLVEKVVDLISSQKLMVERLGDLITKLTKMND
jgi:hypothetical protein